MNKTRRAALEVVKDAISEMIPEVETHRDDEQGYLDAMPESFQQGEKGEAAGMSIDALETALSNLQEALEAIEEAIQ